jgi:hypothetical protein
MISCALLQTERQLRRTHDKDEAMVKGSMVMRDDGEDAPQQAVFTLRSANRSTLTRTGMTP